LAKKDFPLFIDDSSQIMYGAKCSPPVALRRAGMAHSVINKNVKQQSSNFNSIPKSKF
jgi:hypothetical protein